MSQYAKDRLFRLKMNLDIIRIQLSFVKTLKKEWLVGTSLKDLLLKKKNFEKYLFKKRKNNQFRLYMTLIDYKKVLHQIRLIKRVSYWRTLELKFLKLIEKEKHYV